MATLQELMARKAELERQIEEAQTTSRRDALAQIKALMADHDLSLADLEAGSRRTVPKRNGGGAKVAPKYRDQSTGDVWSGRGLKPKWLKAQLDAGRKLEDFAV